VAGCGVCALNNALGGDFVKPAEMIASAEQLDAMWASAKAAIWGIPNQFGMPMIPSPIRNTAGWDGLPWGNIDDTKFASKTGLYYPHVLWWAASKLYPPRSLVFVPSAHKPLVRGRAYILNVLEHKKLVREPPNHFLTLFYKPSGGQEVSLLLDSHTALGQHVQVVCDEDVADLRAGKTQLFDVGKAPKLLGRRPA